MHRPKDPELQIPTQLTLENRPAFGFTNLVQDKKGNPKEETFIVQAEPRSTEGVIYYLGEIARCNLQLDEQSVCTTMPKVHTEYRVGDDDDLFKVWPLATDRSSPSEAKGEAIEVDWARKRYKVDMDPKAKDRSGQVLRILTQVVALNGSAKDFPTPAIIRPRRSGRQSTSSRLSAEAGRKLEQSLEAASPAQCRSTRRSLGQTKGTRGQARADAWHRRCPPPRPLQRSKRPRCSRSRIKVIKVDRL